MSLKWKSTEESSPYCGGSSEFIQQSNGDWIELKPDGTIFTFRCESIQGDTVVLVNSKGRIDITGTECRVNGHLFYKGRFVEEKTLNWESTEPHEKKKFSIDDNRYFVLDLGIIRVFS